MGPFHPLVAEWFERRFQRPTGPQERAWPVLASGGDVLISAPTGSGKTLAAFMVCIDRLIRKALAGELEDCTEVLYVSPLKALGNDIRRNLDQPLAGITELAAERGLLVPPIRTAVRTGDTSPAERERMLRQPPHILVTTPESLFILLTAERSRAVLKTVRTTIIDEIHAVAPDKRGAHLALSLARLDDLVTKSGGTRPQRLGLSATVRPIEEVARFMSPDATAADPADRAAPHAGIRIIDSGHRREMDLAVEVPRDELGAVASKEMWAEIYDRLAALITAHRTTLVFVNTRRLSERIAHELAVRLGEEAVVAHHGSLSRRLRMAAEERLKQGDLKAVVATASLELGIDIGSVNLVCQVGSPRSIAVALQRIGRSGHHVHRASVPKGRIFVTTRDELVESAALVRAIRQGLLDRLSVPEWPRDVLAQQLVAAAACEAWREDDLYDLVRRAWPYRNLPRSEFDSVIEMLSDGIAARRGRASGAYLHRDQVNGLVRARRGGRLAAITSGGAIPDNANYLVVAEPDEAVVGSVDEDFAVESMAGDIFLLGTTSWRIRRVEAGSVRVEDARGAPPSVPFWRGEAPGRTRELSSEVARLREAIAAAGSAEAARDFLMGECGLDRLGAEQAAEYVLSGVAALGAVPTDRCVVAERFFDEGGGMQLVIHAPFGTRINRAWGLALRKRFCRSFNLELQAAATDEGIVISLAEQHSFPLDAVFRFLAVPTLEHVLTQAMLPAPMFTVRWRWNVSRALAVLRFAGGRKVPAPIQRMRSDDLLAGVFPDQAACPENLSGDIRIPDHPLVSETIRDCLHEAMDLDGLTAIIDAIHRGGISTVAVDTPQPSPFSHEILNSNPYAYLDDAPLEERRARAVQLRRTLEGEAGEVGALDPSAIETVSAEAWPVARDADELHDALLTLVVLPVPVSGSNEPGGPAIEEMFAELSGGRRAATIITADAGKALWVAAERLRTALVAYPDAHVVEPVAPADRHVPTEREAASTAIVRGWMESIGPVTIPDLAARLSLPDDLVHAAFLALESEGQVLRGRFTASARNGGAEIEWCNRRLLARIHRLTIGRLRREIEPVTPAVFAHFLYRWQHVAEGTKLHGIEGTLSVLEQLQGCEVVAGAWENDVLPRRVAGYSPEYLDRLCLSGEVAWGRLSPHAAFVTGKSNGRGQTPVLTERGNGSNAGRGSRHFRRFRPTRAVPIAIFLRDAVSWLVDAANHREDLDARREALSPAARRVLQVLETRGASFRTELAAATGRAANEVDEALWEMAASGLAAADGFDELRALIHRPGKTARRGTRAWRAIPSVPARRARHAGGRWALLAASGSPSPERTEAFARQLLRRWGIVFRDLAVRETLAPAWRDLLVAYRRMEARGEVRGGRFVSGFIGEQFAEPAAIDALRAVRHMPMPEHLPEVSAADPLNLPGVLSTPLPLVLSLKGQEG